MNKERIPICSSSSYPWYRLIQRAKSPSMMPWWIPWERKAGSEWIREWLRSRNPTAIPAQNQSDSWGAEQPPEWCTGSSLSFKALRGQTAQCSLKAILFHLQNTSVISQNQLINPQTLTAEPSETIFSHLGKPGISGTSTQAMELSQKSCLAYSEDFPLLFLRHSVCVFRYFSLSLQNLTIPWGFMKKKQEQEYTLEGKMKIWLSVIAM